MLSTFQASTIYLVHPRWIGIGIVFLFCFSTISTSAQSVPQTGTAISDSLQTSLLISRVKFRGNEIFTQQQLEARVRTRANRRFLRIPGFNWWLWLYRIGDSGVFGNHVGRALKATGEPPAYIDDVVLEQDVERLQIYYRQAGFRNAHVEARIDTLTNRRLEVVFFIDQGRPTFLRDISYDINSLSRAQHIRLIEASLLFREAQMSEDSLSFMPSGQWFSEALMLEERRRILDYLRNEGFAAVTRDSIRAIIIPTHSPDSLDISWRIRPGRRFSFGNVHFDVSGPENTAPASYALDDTSGAQEKVTAIIAGDRKLKADLLGRSLQFKPGEWYNQESLLSTKRRLEATGVFSLTRIDPLWSDTSSLKVGVGSELPHRILLETRERHQMRFEAFMLQRNGVLDASENELGTGLGITYENVNLLGRGESFRLSTTGSIAADTDFKVFSSAQVEIVSSVTLPYLVAPFRGLESKFDLYDARTQIALSFLTARREALSFVIRGRGTARFRLEMQHKPNLTSYVDLFDISLSNPDTLRGFEQIFLGSILDSIDDPVQQAQVQEDYTQPQINNALRYTRRSANVDLLRRDQGYSYEGSFEIGGNLPYLVDRFINTPGTLEGRIPGLSLFKGSESENSLIYRQYMRLSGDLRQYKPISQNSIFAWKFIGGIAHPTGKADLVPFDRRFYSGGSVSVRGWELRGLGPGRTTTDSTASITGVESSILGGDIKLEASVELRSTVLREVLAADWIFTLFGDAGNVWFGPRNPGPSQGQFTFSNFYKEFGVGSGFGLRLAWDYLILRLDFAYRIYDPARPGGFFENAFRESRLHFGIGHAF